MRISPYLLPRSFAEHDTSLEVHEMTFRIEQDVEKLQSLTDSISGQLDELYAKLGTVVTAVATLNGELDELPTPKYLCELISD